MQEPDFGVSGHILRTGLEGRRGSTGYQGNVTKLVPVRKPWSYVDLMMTTSESIESARPSPSLASHNLPSWCSRPCLPMFATTTVKTLAIRNSAEELMISRRAQLKGQDQKVSSSLTDDFTMRNFIAVSLRVPALQRFVPSPTALDLTFFVLSPSFLKNPSFMQETAYEPLILDVPLLGRNTNETSRKAESALMDTVVTVEDEQSSSLPSLEAQQPTIEEYPPLKKKRTIRFAE